MYEPLLRSFVENFLMLGDKKDTESDELQKKLESLLDQVQEVYSKLASVKSGKSKMTVKSLAESTSRSYPRMTFNVSESGYGEEGVPREASVGLDKGSFFYSMNDTGEYVYADAPIHSFWLTLTPGGLSSFTKLNYTVNPRVRVENHINNENLKIENCLGLESCSENYGHPHVNGSDSDSMRLTTICTGNNRFVELFKRIRRLEDVGVFLHSVYDWLTHINIGDSYNSAVTPIRWDDDEYHSIIRFYNRLADSMGDIYTGAWYKEFVEKARKNSLVAGDITRYQSVMETNLYPFLQGSKSDYPELADQFGNMCAYLSSTNTYNICRVLCVHTLLSAAMLWKRDDEDMPYMLKIATLSDFILLPYAWCAEEMQLMARLAPYAFPDEHDDNTRYELISPAEVVRYFNSYEYLCN